MSNLKKMLQVVAAVSTSTLGRDSFIVYGKEKKLNADRIEFGNWLDTLCIIDSCAARKYIKAFHAGPDTIIISSVTPLGCKFLAHKKHLSVDDCIRTYGDTEKFWLGEI